MPSLVFRADASTAMGTGHVMRCLALAQAWRDRGGQAIFAMATEVANLTSRLTTEGIDIQRIETTPGSDEDARATAECAKRVGAIWIVVDGYHFLGRYQSTIKKAGLRLLYLDDFGHAEYYPADLVLNQNLHAAESLYPNREAHTKLLLGTRYVLLRREFAPWRGWNREISEAACKVLVTLGGSDSANVTLKVIDALKHVEVTGLDAVVLVGAANPNRAELEAAVRDTAAIRLQMCTSDMPALLAWADVAVAAGGTTSWELAFMGVPALTIILAENQRAVAEQLDADRVAVNLGWFETITSEMIAARLNWLLADAGKRLALSRNGKAFVDGGGTDRVLQRMDGRNLQLRRVSADDCRQIWEWSNDTAVRAVSFASQAIPWESHTEWFQGKLSDPDCLLFVAENEAGEAIGQARCEATGEEATLSISVAKTFRGRGYGQMLIRSASFEVFRVSDVATIHAYIKPDNLASVRAFQEADFEEAQPMKVRGQAALHFILRKKAR